MQRDIVKHGINTFTLEMFNQLGPRRQIIGKDIKNVSIIIPLAIGNWQSQKTFVRKRLQSLKISIKETFPGGDDLSGLFKLGKEERANQFAWKK